jgi:hypothetical protein
MSDHGRDTEAEDAGATGLVQEERRALTNSDTRGHRADEQGTERAGERTTGDDEVVKRGERDLSSE